MEICVYMTQFKSARETKVLALREEERGMKPPYWKIDSDWNSMMLVLRKSRTHPWRNLYLENSLATTEEKTWSLNLTTPRTAPALKKSTISGQRSL